MSAPKPLSTIPAAGQPQRLFSVTREAALHDQLFRYAEDLQAIIQQHGDLQARYDKLRTTSACLAESRDLFDDLLRLSKDLHLVTDLEGRIRQTNPAAESIAPPSRMTGSSLENWIAATHVKAYRAALATAAGAENGVSFETELRLHPEFPEQPLLIVAAQLLVVKRRDDDNCLYWILRDITRQREVEFDTQIATQVYEHSTEAVMITDIAGTVLSVNPAFVRITGYSAAEIVGRNPRMLNSGVQDASFYEKFWAALQANGTWEGEIYNRRKNGEVYPEWLSVSTVRDADGSPLTYIATFTDLTRLMHMERHLSHLAHHDPLTGLPNRLLFEERLSQLIHLSLRSGDSFCLIFIDLDKFKPINDTLGHEAGDQVIQEAARRLSAAVRSADTVARIGGDEYVILASGLSGDTDIARFCAKIMAELGQPFSLFDQAVDIGASLGCAEFPRHGDTAITLMARADAAMYRAKHAGGKRHAMASDKDSKPGATSMELLS